MTSRSFLLPVALAMAASLGACSSSGEPASGGSLTIAAAASLKNVLAQVKSAYGTSHPGSTLTITTDASSALEAQIEQGAPFDIFLSADTTNPQKLVDAGLASSTPMPFTGNELTLIVPTANPASITSPADLATPGINVIAAGDAVPITRYANQLVENLADVAGYPADFGAAYAANVLSKEESVASVLSKIELGEGDVAIVYVTDAKASAKVIGIAIPAGANVSATYAGVVVKASTKSAAAATFMTWLVGPEAQAIFGSFGFLPPP